MPEYVSIKSDVLRKLAENLPELRERFGIDTIGIFGSVARSEDTPASDVDLLYTFQDGRGSMHEYAGVTEFLEELIGRNIDFVSLKWLSPRLRPYVEPDMILLSAREGAAA